MMKSFLIGHELKALLLAAEVGNIDRMRSLIDATKQWNLTDQWMTKGDRKGRTPIHLASIYGYVNVIEFIVDEVINNIDNEIIREKYKNLRDYRGRSCVFHAAAEGRKTVLAYLLAHGADPNLGTNQNHYEPGSTPLMASAEKNEIECFNILVDKGADLFKTRDDGADAIYIAARFGHIELIKTFFERLIENEREKVVVKMVNRPTFKGRTPLLTAALHGHILVLKEFLDHGACIDHQDDRGYTAVMYAASSGHYDIVKTLISSGANLSKKNKSHDNALKCAMLNDENDIAKLIKTFTSSGTTADKEGEEVDTIVTAKQESKKRKGTELTRKYSKRAQK